MIGKYMFLTCCLFTSSLFAFENGIIENSRQIGKYQLNCNGLEIYLLDTETGTIWVAQRNNWKKEIAYYPWVQLDNPIAN
jgi:hypothetical protein